MYRVSNVLITTTWDLVLSPIANCNAREFLVCFFSILFECLQLMRMFKWLISTVCKFDMGHNPRSREGVTAWICKCYQDTHDWFTPSVHGIIHENTQSMYLTDTYWLQKYGMNRDYIYLSYNTSLSSIYITHCRTVKKNNYLKNCIPTTWAGTCPTQNIQTRNH